MKRECENISLSVKNNKWTTKVLGGGKIKFTDAKDEESKKKITI